MSDTCVCERSSRQLHLALAGLALAAVDFARHLAGFALTAIDFARHLAGLALDLAGSALDLAGFVLPHVGSAFAFLLLPRCQRWKRISTIPGKIR